VTDELPNPKRKRRRWIIAGALLFVALAWWHWPRGDQRFVGKWLMQSKSSRKLTWTFNSNGRGYTSVVNERGEGGWSAWSWSVDGDVLAIGTDYGRWDSTAKWLSLQLEERTGRTFEPLQSQFPIRRFDGDTLEIGGGFGDSVWHRITD
jgi:hypothetical protein